MISTCVSFVELVDYQSRQVFFYPGRIFWSIGNNLVEKILVEFSLIGSVIQDVSSWVVLSSTVSSYSVESSKLESVSSELESVSSELESVSSELESVSITYVS